MKIVEKMQELCKDAGTSLAALEKELGFGKGTMYRWDDSTPSVDKVQKVADRFNVSIDYILGRSEDEDVDQLREILHKNPETKTLLSASAKLTTDDINAVIEIVKRMNRESGLDD